MKKFFSMLVAVLLLLSCVIIKTPTVHAATKANQTRSIAIVFDNSGSMYIEKKQDWCRATYAMEVFASMLNKGDVLTIYPMWPIEVDGKTYSMESPFKITESFKIKRRLILGHLIKQIVHIKKCTLLKKGFHSQIFIFFHGLHQGFHAAPLLSGCIIHSHISAC